jgi:hypothetical protein
MNATENNKMNSNQMAVEAVAMVAPEKGRGLTVTVRGNVIAVQLVRDPFDSAAFENYNTILGRTWDALSAIKGCRFNKHRGGGVEIGNGRSGYRMELYTVTFEVFTVAQVRARVETLMAGVN